jgi:hypothetical protein
MVQKKLKICLVIERKDDFIKNVINPRKPNGY